MNERSTKSRPAAPGAPTGTRERVLAASARLFHEQGFHATGIATILRESGVNAGSLYHFFPSKEALLRGVLEQYTRLLMPIVMEPVEKKTKDPIGRVFALLAQYREWLAPAGFTLGCPIGNLALETSDTYRDARRLIDANFEGWIGVVRGWLMAAKGRLPRGLDRDQLARFILTVMEGGVMQARAAGSPEPYDASVAQLRAYFDLLEHAARGDTARPSGRPRKRQKR